MRANLYQRNHEDNPLVGLGSTARAQSELKIKPFYFPFLNSTIFCLMTWFYKTSMKTLTDLNDLVSDIFSDDYDQEVLIGFSALQESHHLDDPFPSKIQKIYLDHLLSQSIVLICGTRIQFNYLSHSHTKDLTVKAMHLPSRSMSIITNCSKL